MFGTRLPLSSRTLTSVALTAAVVSAGCSSAVSHREAFAPPTRATVVEVRNQGWSDIVVYVVRSGMKWRLGTVTSLNARTFTLPDAVVPEAGTLRLLADPIGGNPHVTAPFQALSGQRIALTVQNVMAMSHVSVWGQ